MVIETSTSFNPEELQTKRGKTLPIPVFLQDSSSNKTKDSGWEKLEINEPEGGFQKIFFETPVEMLLTINSPLREARIDPSTGRETRLHKWQIRLGNALGRGQRYYDGQLGEMTKPSSLHPYKFSLCAANGSGKDKFVIAPFAVWFITSKIKSIVVITSSSTNQLNTQTESYIRSLCREMNKWTMETMGREVIEIRKHRITCTLSGSEIFLFVTDEAGKAEGYHPVDIGTEMAIIVNEAKSVNPDIFAALRRCTGYNYWINVSTPKEPQGDFYDSFERWPNRLKVTYYDCPHQSPSEFEEEKIKLGEHNPWFRSKWLAEFAFTDGKYVVSQISLHKLRKQIALGNIVQVMSDKLIRVGIDIALSTNGDESVISAFRGNKQILLEHIRIKDATILASNIDKVLREKLKLSKDHAYIFADDGGVGRAVVDILRRTHGWKNIKRVLNQSRAKKKNEYRNRGAEIWHKFAKLVESGSIILIDDEKLYSQIASRKFKESTAGIDKLCLQSKREMIIEGLPSPDRADATILAFTDTKVEEFINNYVTSTKEDSVKPKESKEDMMERLRLEMRNGWKNEGKMERVKRFSLRNIKRQLFTNERMMKWQLK